MPFTTIVEFPRVNDSEVKPPFVALSKVYRPNVRLLLPKPVTLIVAVPEPAGSAERSEGVGDRCAGVGADVEIQRHVIAEGQGAADLECASFGIARHVVDRAGRQRKAAGGSSRNRGAGVRPRLERGAASDANGGVPQAAAGSEPKNAAGHGGGPAVGAHAGEREDAVTDLDDVARADKGPREGRIGIVGANGQRAIAKQDLSAPLGFQPHRRATPA